MLVLCLEIICLTKLKTNGLTCSILKSIYIILVAVLRLPFCFDKANIKCMYMLSSLT